VSLPPLLADLKVALRTFPLLPSPCRQAAFLAKEGVLRWGWLLRAVPQYLPGEAWGRTAFPSAGQTGSDCQLLWLATKVGVMVILQMHIAKAPAELQALRWYAEKKVIGIQDLLPLPRQLLKNSFYSEVNFGFKQCSESVTNPKAEFKSLKYDF